MAQRWFSDQELAEMARPTMDRAIEALDRGDTDGARALCEEMKHEWRYRHDLMAGGLLALISFVQERLGDDGVAEAWRYGNERGWRGDVEKIEDTDRRQIVQALAATWRGRLGLGPGADPGRVRDRGGRGEVHLPDDPVRLGPAPVAERRLPR